MNTSSLHTALFLFTLFSVSITTSAGATEAAKSDTTVSGSLALVSNYVWRGQSQTWGNPALQFGIEAGHVSGAYAGFWASNVSDQWVPGTRIETDWYAGMRGNLPAALSELSYEVNLNYAYFPGGEFNKTGFALPSSSPNTVEFSSAVTHHWLTLRGGTVLTKFYGWDISNSSPGGFAGDPTAGVTGSTKGSYFIQADVSKELAPTWTLLAQVGHQTIRHSTGLSWSYYKLGVSKSIQDWVASLAYSASSEPKAFRDFVGLKNNGSIYSAAKPAVVFVITKNF
ncbi:MAG: TorF family putative porin [Gallionella sp.]